MWRYSNFYIEVFFKREPERMWARGAREEKKEKKKWDVTGDRESDMWTALDKRRSELKRSWTELVLWIKFLLSWVFTEFDHWETGLRVCGRSGRALLIMSAEMVCWHECSFSTEGSWDIASFLHCCLTTVDVLKKYRGYLFISETNQLVLNDFATVF